MKQNNTANASSEEPNLFYNATCWLFCILFTLKRHCDVRTSSENDVRSFLSRSHSFSVADISRHIILLHVSFKTTTFQYQILSDVRIIFFYESCKSHEYVW